MTTPQQGAGISLPDSANGIFPPDHPDARFTADQLTAAVLADRQSRAPGEAVAPGFVLVPREPPVLVPFEYVHPREVVNSFYAGESLFLVDEQNTPWPVIGATERMVSYECVWVKVKGHMQYKFYPNGRGERDALKLLRRVTTPQASAMLAAPTAGIAPKAAEAASPDVAKMVTREAAEEFGRAMYDAGMDANSDFSDRRADSDMKRSEAIDALGAAATQAKASAPAEAAILQRARNLIAALDQPFRYPHEIKAARDALAAALGDAK